MMILIKPSKVLSNKKHCHSALDAESSILLFLDSRFHGIKSVVRLGAKQSDTCLHLIREAYEQARQYTGTAPDISSLLAIGEEIYQDEDKPPDSLLATLRDFADFPLFRRAIEGERHNLLETNHIIDLHHLPESLRKIAVF
ncbi:MAG: hypothetical protein HZA13_00760 [Nitrospirae bacterium]|nr:hypothetical protein [Nitrospirota bacterium]